MKAIEAIRRLLNNGTMTEETVISGMVFAYAAGANDLAEGKLRDIKTANPVVVTARLYELLQEDIDE